MPKRGMSFVYAFNHVIIVAEQTYICTNKLRWAIIIRTYYMTIWSKFVSCVIIFDNDRLNWFIIHVNKIRFITVIIIWLDDNKMCITVSSLCTYYIYYRTSDNITRRHKVQGHRPHQLLSPDAATTISSNSTHANIKIEFSFFSLPGVRVFCFLYPTHHLFCTTLQIDLVRLK